TFTPKSLSVRATSSPPSTVLGLGMDASLYRHGTPRGWSVRRGVDHAFGVDEPDNHRTHSIGHDIPSDRFVDGDQPQHTHPSPVELQARLPRNRVLTRCARSDQRALTAKRSDERTQAHASADQNSSSVCWSP